MHDARGRCRKDRSARMSFEGAASSPYGATGAPPGPVSGATRSPACAPPPNCRGPRRTWGTWGTRTTTRFSYGAPAQGSCRRPSTPSHERHRPDQAVRHHPDPPSRAHHRPLGAIGGGPVRGRGRVACVSAAYEPSSRRRRLTSSTSWGTASLAMAMNAAFSSQRPSAQSTYRGCWTKVVAINPP